MADKISKDEFDKKVKELMELTDEDTRVFVVSYTEKQDSDVATDIEYYGAGCPACAVNVIMSMMIKNAFVHTGPNPTEGLSKDN